jgi:tetratricopeptide (TPR) repeat protein
MLLLPDVAGAREVAGEIVRGGVPEVWPPALRFYAAALEGPARTAAALVPGDDLVARYNRAVLVGGEGVWETLAADTHGPLRALVQTARFSIGQIDRPPSAEGLTGEVAAMVHSARASAAMERGDGAAAVEALRKAVDAAVTAPSPVLAASLRLTLAQVLAGAGDAAASAAEAEAALQALPLTADRELRAHLQVARGLARQQFAGGQRGALQAVVQDLTEATKVFREETHPELFALCNEQLALAYLVMPMSDGGDRLRLGIAVNALRAALRVYTPARHPVQWAGAQVNLANALQYLPSAHRQDNLDEAVQLYEEVLQQRDPGDDPVGYARILSNQGNALGHLGVFPEARDRLTRARDLFEQAGDDDAVGTVGAILAGLEEAAVAAGRAD